MKKRALYIVTALFASLALSCNKEQDMSTPLPVDTEEDGVMYVQMMNLNLDAATGGPSTRTVFEKDGNGLKTKWVSTDKIGILIPATAQITVSDAMGTTSSSVEHSYRGFPLGSPTLYSEGRTAVYSGVVPAYIKVSERSGRTETTTVTTLDAGTIQAFYPSLPSTTQQAILIEGGSTTTNFQMLNLAQSLSLASQSGTLEGLGEKAIMTATGTLATGYQGSGSNRRLVGALSEPMQFKQEVAVLHINHMWLGYGDDINMSEGLTLTFSGTGIGNAARFSSTNGNMSVTAGDIVISLTEDDVCEGEWDADNNQYIFPEGCGKVIMYTDEADMDGGTYYLEDLYIAFLPKNFQSGAELSLMATGVGYGSDFQGEYFWNARTAYQAGKVYHLRDKEMESYKLLSAGSTLSYYDDGYKPLNGSSFYVDDEFFLYVENNGDVINASEIAYWNTSDDQVARVEGDKIICVGNGSAVITAKDKNGTTVSAQVTVVGQTLSSWDYLTADVAAEDMIAIDGIPQILLFTGETLQLKIKHGNEILNPRCFTWSGGGGVVSVDNNGLVTRQVIGEGRITATDTEGNSVSVIVVAQNSSSAEFCNARGAALQGTWESPFALTELITQYPTYLGNGGGDRAIAGYLYVHPSGENSAFKTKSTISAYNYLKVTKIEDCVGNTDYGDLTINSVVRERGVFYSRDTYSHARFLVSYNGPYGKIGPVELNVVHDKLTANITHDGPDVISPASPIFTRLTATSALGYPIQWAVTNWSAGSQSNYDSDGLPISSTYLNGWTTNSGETRAISTQLAMTKDGKIQKTTLNFNASTIGGGGVTDGFTLTPSLVGASIVLTPIKHDYAMENINIGDYVQWDASSSTLKIGAGCGFYESILLSSRSKCAAAMKIVYPGRSTKAYLDGYDLLYYGIFVDPSCSEQGLLRADNYYYRDDNIYMDGPKAKAIYLTRTIQSSQLGTVVVSDQLGNSQTIYVLMYPNKVQ